MYIYIYIWGRYLQFRFLKWPLGLGCLEFCGCIQWTLHITQYDSTRKPCSWCSWEIISDLAIPSLKMGRRSVVFWFLIVFSRFSSSRLDGRVETVCKTSFFAGSTWFHHRSLKTRHRKPSVRSNIPCRFLFFIVYHHIPCKFGVTSPSLQRPTDVQLQVLIFKVLWLGYRLIN